MRFMGFVFLFSLVTTTTVNAESGMGIGPITKPLNLPASIDAKLVELGKTTFKTKCSQCHKIDKRYTGPKLLGVTKRRKPEWIMNMILNPQEMTHKDPTAMKLLNKLLVQMANQNVGEANARAILEFFRDNDKKVTEADAAKDDLSK